MQTTEQRKTYVKAYYQENKNQIIERQKKWYQANKERIAAKYRINHPMDNLTDKRPVSDETRAKISEAMVKFHAARKGITDNSKVIEFSINENLAEASEVLAAWLKSINNNPNQFNRVRCELY